MRHGGEIHQRPNEISGSKTKALKSTNQNPKKTTETKRLKEKNDTEKRMLLSIRKLIFKFKKKKSTWKSMQVLGNDVVEVRVTPQLEGPTGEAIAAVLGVYGGEKRALRTPFGEMVGYFGGDGSRRVIWRRGFRCVKSADCRSSCGRSCCCCGRHWRSLAPRREVVKEKYEGFIN